MGIRVVIYTHAFAPQIGGVETYVMLLARGLSGTDVQVTVVTSTEPGAMNDAELPFPVVRRPGVAKLAKMIGRADILHLAGPCFLPMTLGLVFQKAVVVEHHGYQAVCPNGLLLFEPAKTVCPGHFMARRYQKCLGCNSTNIGRVKGGLGICFAVVRRWVSAHVTLHLPISNHVKSRIRLPRSRVIYYGVPGMNERVENTLGQYVKPSIEDIVIFAYVGRLVSEKGLPLVIEAAGRLKKTGYGFRLKFVGDGPERARLEKAVDASGLRDRVTFTGLLGREELKNALSDVSAVVMPSIWEETAGLSAIEHMMRGRLVIATDIGGLGEVVGSAGLKFPLGDMAGLTACMKRVLDQPGLVREIGEKARQRALSLFREERMVAEHRAVYLDVLRLPNCSPTYLNDKHSFGND